MLETLLDHFVSGAPLFARGTAAGIQIDSTAVEEDPADADIIEQIKERLPVWKHETYADGGAEWLDGEVPLVNSHE